MNDDCMPDQWHHHTLGEWGYIYIRRNPKNKTFRWLSWRSISRFSNSFFVVVVVVIVDWMSENEHGIIDLRLAVNRFLPEWYTTTMILRHQHFRAKSFLFSVCCRHVECWCYRWFDSNGTLFWLQVDVATVCKGNFDCVNNAECLDGQCFCRNGFQPKGATCVDVDECTKSPCGPNSVCTNLAGSHRCECEAGFVGKPPTTPCKGMKIK